MNNEHQFEKIILNGFYGKTSDDQLNIARLFDHLTDIFPNKKWVVNQLFSLYGHGLVNLYIQYNAKTDTVKPIIRVKHCSLLTQNGLNELNHF